MTATLDTHRMVKRLRDAGASEPLAEAVTDAVREGRDLDLAQLATKADLAALAAATKADLAEVKADVALVRAELTSAESRLEARIERAKNDTTRWVVGAGLAQVLALVGAVLAIVRFLPGGHP